MILLNLQVWTDQKKYVRQKAAQNLQYKKGTGGGPNREHSFSATEQSIYDLIGMKTSVEGVAAKSFGLESPSNAKEMPQVPAEIDVLDVSMQDGLINEKLVASTDLGLCETPKSFQKSKDNAFPNSKGDSAKSASNMLLAELAVQKELVETVKEAVGDAKDQKESIKRIYRSLDSIYGLQKKHFQAMEKMKREQIDEMRRHNTFMEEMRLKEVEYKLEKNRLQFQFNDLTTNN